jgi:hypothetical protein
MGYGGFIPERGQLRKNENKIKQKIYNESELRSLAPWKLGCGLEYGSAGVTKVVEVRRQVTGPETGCYEVCGHEGCPQVKLTTLYQPCYSHTHPCSPVLCLTLPGLHPTPTTGHFV